MAERLQLVPGVEVRSAGDLRIAEDFSLDSGVAPGIGSAMTLTLRAARDLNVSHSLSSGFSTPVAAASIAQAGDAARLRLVAGADLSAADPLATIARTGPASSPDNADNAVNADNAGNPSGGNLVIGRAAGSATAAAPAVFVRSTVGHLDLAAGGDIQLLNNSVRVYTTGVPTAASSLPGYGRLNIGSNQTLRNGSTPVGPFFEGAGDIRLQAAGSIVGSPTRQYATDWWWRQTGLSAEGAPASWYSRYDLFQQGIASFGGGHIDVIAGGKVVDLELSTPGSGYDVNAVSRSDGSNLPALNLSLPGGALSVRAGGDIVSGLFFAGGPMAQLRAGGSIRPAASTGLGQSHPGAQLFYLDTQWTLVAQDQLTLGSLVNPALLSGVVQVTGQARGDVIVGLDNHAALSALSVAGDLTISGTRTALSPSTDPRNTSSDIARQAPGTLLLAAPSGAVVVNAPLLQRPAGDGVLQVLAEDGVSLGRVVVGAATARVDVAPMARIAATTALTRDWSRTTDGVPALDASRRDPVRVVARSGDVTLAADVASARPLRLSAGRDVRGSGSAAVTLQHQGGGELSLVLAGRDIVLADNSAARLRIAGPGDALLLAGRHVDLQGAAGIVTIGNQDNPRLLPDGGASITVVAGVDWGAADYRQAAADGFVVLGGGVGLTSFAPALYALAGGAGDAQAVAAGAQRAGGAQRSAVAAASSFAGLSPTDQLHAALALADPAGWQASVLATMRLRLNDPTLQAAAALTAFAGLPAAERAALSSTVTDPVPAMQRVRAALARQQTGQPALSDSAALIDWQALPETRRTLLQPTATVQLLTPMITADQLRAQSQQWLAALAPEQQALVLHDVLFEELRIAGRVAARLPSGPDRNAAYAPAYAALAALYPGSRPVGDIRLAASQIKTQQGGDIRLLAPGGAIDAGALAGATSKRSSDLGILTTAGGNIEAAARGNFAVNQSRVFTLAQGDLLLWSSDGNIDAGKGARTVSGAPPPVYSVDNDGNVVVDTSGSFSGSGIAVLDASSILDLYAPKGEISAGEAGIKPRGIVYLGTENFVGQVEGSGNAIGAPPPPPPAGATAALANVAQSAAVATAASTAREDDDDSRPRKRRRNLLLEFLGFGPAE